MILNLYYLTGQESQMKPTCLNIKSLKFVILLWEEKNS